MLLCVARDSHEHWVAAPRGDMLPYWFVSSFLLCCSIFLVSLVPTAFSSPSNTYGELSKFFKWTDPSSDLLLNVLVNILQDAAGSTEQRI